MTYKNLLASILILIAVVGAWTILSSRGKNPMTPKANTRPDALMEEVTATIMDKQGKVSMKIVTPKLVHYVENDTTHLTAPTVTLYRKSPEPWYITSTYAKATQGIENVFFWENVNIHHSADQKNPATLIQTPTLLVHPNKQIAETSDSITMNQPNITVKAIGMYADMNTGNIKLLADAKGVYVPNS